MTFSFELIPWDISEEDYIDLCLKPGHRYWSSSSDTPSKNACKNIIQKGKCHYDPCKFSHSDAYRYLEHLEYVKKTKREISQRYRKSMETPQNFSIKNYGDKDIQDPYKLSFGKLVDNDKLLEKFDIPILKRIKEQRRQLEQDYMKQRELWFQSNCSIYIDVIRRIVEKLKRYNWRLSGSTAYFYFPHYDSLQEYSGKCLDFGKDSRFGGCRYGVPLPLDSEEIEILDKCKVVYSHSR